MRPGRGPDRRRLCRWRRRRLGLDRGTRRRGHPPRRRRPPPRPHPRPRRRRRRTHLRRPTRRRPILPPPSPSPSRSPETTLDPEEATTAAQINEYIAEAAAFDQVGADAQFPEGLTFAAGGAPGYSRYVFREHSDGVVPTLVEGPDRQDTRPLSGGADLPCSYLELRELHESGAQDPRRAGHEPQGVRVTLVWSARRAQRVRRGPPRCRLGVCRGLRERPHPDAEHGLALLQAGLDRRRVRPVTSRRSCSTPSPTERCRPTDPSGSASTAPGTVSRWC